jgi:exonuclease VII small subunit
MEQNEQSFEEKLALADKILNDLNKDDVSLENSIKLHEQGKKLLNEAREILENAKLSIKQVDDE